MMMMMIVMMILMMMTVMVMTMMMMMLMMMVVMVKKKIHVFFSSVSNMSTHAGPNLVVGPPSFLWGQRKPTKDNI